MSMLTAKAVDAIRHDGKHPVGGGVYLEVEGAARRWSCRVQADGKRREFGLGPAGAKDGLSLGEARQVANAIREALGTGADPLAARNYTVAYVKAIAKRMSPEEAREEAARIAQPVARDGTGRTIKTFGEAADAYIQDTVEPALRNAKHIAQWRVTLGTVPFDDTRVRSDKKAHKAYVSALADLRAKPISKVDVADVLAVLTPIWRVAPETANRLRGRIERVLDATRAKGLRKGENPARWRGHLDHLLPARHRLARGHHAALPYADVPAFMKTMEGREDVSASLLAFIVLTACRTGEARGAQWCEFDLDKAVWTIPAKRMKAGREHRVPLASQVMELIQRMERARVSAAPNALVFPGKGGMAVSVMTPAMALRRLATAWKGEGACPWADVTVHGFRSAFRDWAGEETSFPREIAEAALAHVVGDSTERAYRRGDALERRRELMAAWADFAMSTQNGANVLPFASDQDRKRSGMTA